MKASGMERKVQNVCISSASKNDLLRGATGQFTGSYSGFNDVGNNLTIVDFFWIILCIKISLTFQAMD